MNKEEFKQTLVEVRRAYRLLYLYQRRTLDLIDFIGNEMSFTFNGGHSKFSNASGTKSNVKLNKWAWDWLQLYCYDFNFGRIININDTNIYLHIVLQSDSGFFESGAQDKLDISKFKDAEESSTKIYFVIGQEVTGCPISNILMEQFKANSVTNKVEVSENKKWLSKSYSLEEFLNKEAALNVINNFKLFCSSEKVELKVKQLLT